jgi:hypothetical protein
LEKKTNVKQIIFHGNQLLWNENMNRRDYILLRNELELLANNYTEVVELKIKVEEIFEKNA